MADLVVSLLLKADGSALVGEVRRSDAAVEKLSGGIKKSGAASATTARQTDELSRQQQRLRGSMRGVSDQSRTMIRLFALLGGTLLLRELIRTADAWKLIGSRLKVVSDGAAALTRNQERLIAISQETRTAFQATALLFERIARGRDELKAGAEEILQFTENVQKLTVISGASAQEATAAVIQLAQGLASGELRGEELRSVMEQLPALARAFADGLGVSLAKFRELSLEGKITAKDIFDALLTQTAKIDEQFAQIAVTVGQASTVFANALGVFISEADKASGASSALSDGVLLAAENVDLLAAGLAGLVASGAVVFIARFTPQIVALSRAMLGLNVVMAANPIGVWAVGLGLAVAAIALLVSRTGDAEDAQKAFNEAVERGVAVNRDLRDASADRVKDLQSERAEILETMRAELALLLTRRDELKSKVGNLQAGGLGTLILATQQRADLVVLNAQVIKARQAFGLFRVSLEDTSEATEELSAKATTLIADLQFEASLIGKAEQQRRVAIALRKAETTAASEQGEKIAQLVTLLFDEEQVQKAVNKERKESERRLKAENKAREDAERKVKARLAQEAVVLQNLRDEAALAQARLRLAGADERSREVELRLLEEINAARARGVPLAEEALALRRELIETIVDSEIAEEQAREAAEAQREIFNNAIQGIQGSFTDMFETAFGVGRRESFDFFDEMLILAKRTAAQIAALLVFRPILAGTLSFLGLGGGTQASGGGLFGGGGFNLPISPTSLLPSGSITGGLNSFGTSFGFSNGLGASGLGGTAASSLPASSGLFGATTFSSFLGGAGLGFGAGTLLNSILGGNTTGGTIGSAGGALAGAAIGSIVPGIGTILGGLIGGAGGGLLGGLFGPGKSVGPNSGSNINISGGRFVAGTLGADNGGDLGLARTFQAEVVSALNAILGASGGTLTGAGSLGRIEIFEESGGLFIRRGNRVEAFGDQQSLTSSFLRGGLDRTTDIDPRLRGAIERSLAIRGDVNDTLSDVAFARDFLADNDNLSPLEAELRALNEAFRETERRARELGLPLDGLNKLLTEQTAAIRDRAAADRDLAFDATRDFFSDIVDPLRAARIGLSVGNLSPLSPGDQLDEARAEFDRLSGLARRGNLEAIADLPGAGQTLLQVGQNALAPSGPGFADLFREVNDVLGRTIETVETRRDDLFADFSIDMVGAVERQTDTLGVELKGMRRELTRILAELKGLKVAA